MRDKISAIIELMANMTFMDGRRVIFLIEEGFYVNRLSIEIHILGNPYSAFQQKPTLTCNESGGSR